MKNSKNIEKMIQDLHDTTTADMDNRTISDILRTFESKQNQKSAFSQPNIWRIILNSRITKLAAAAVVVLVVVFGINLWPIGNGKWWLGPSDVWGKEILSSLDAVKGVTCREQTIFVMSDGTKHLSSTWDTFYVSHDSYRRDIYDNNQLREIQWYVPDGNDTVHTSVRFDLNSYFISRGAGSFGNEDPIKRMRFYVGLLDKADKFLGEQVVEGHNCIGFEISASKYGTNPPQWIDRIWFDTKTKLPVRIEYEGRPVTNHPEETFTTIEDHFDYNLQIPSDTFVPKIPEGFVFGHPDDIQAGRNKKSYSR